MPFCPFFFSVKIGSRLLILYQEEEKPILPRRAKLTQQKKVTSLDSTSNQETAKPKLRARQSHSFDCNQTYVKTAHRFTRSLSKEGEDSDKVRLVIGEYKSDMRNELTDKQLGLN